MSNKNLNLENIREHWRSWATKFGTDLRATTKSNTVKQIEIYTLVKTIELIKSSLPIKSKVLEIGCGNGYNLLSLYPYYPNYCYEGIDFIEEMISFAEKNKMERGIPSSAMKFEVGNVLDLEGISNNYDLIFTVRCLINLNTSEMQLNAIKNIATKLKSGAYLLMLENSQSSYDKQNYLRELVGLEKRVPAEFNRFFDDEMINKISSFGLREEKNEGFTGLHDLALYLIVPLINGGKVDYSHPLVEAATKIALALSTSDEDKLGDYGQNRLYLYKKI